MDSISATPWPTPRRCSRVRTSPSGVEVAPEGRYATGLSVVDAGLWAHARVWSDEEAAPVPSDAAPAAGAGRGAAERLAIADHVARLVPAGATVQLGIGALSEAIASALGGTAELGVHSGMLPNSLRTELAAGRFPGTAKMVDSGLAVATSLAPNAGPAGWPASVRAAAAVPDALGRGAFLITSGCGRSTPRSASTLVGQVKRRMGGRPARRLRRGSDRFHAGRARSSIRRRGDRAPRRAPRAEKAASFRASPGKPRPRPAAVMSITSSPSTASRA